MSDDQTTGTQLLELVYNDLPLIQTAPTFTIRSGSDCKHTDIDISRYPIWNRIVAGQARRK